MIIKNQPINLKNKIYGEIVSLVKTLKMQKNPWEAGH